MKLESPGAPTIRSRWAVALLTTATSLAGAGPQEHLEPRLNPPGERVLHYDWPLLRVGTGSYEEGPTGVTVFHFEDKVQVAVDVRGGGPGTVNAPYMELGYDMPELDTVVFAGGSWYGLEAVTGVATALKDDGIRDGNAFSEEPNIAMSVGSIIFDFGPRRLNEIYPDKRLAQATFRSASSGSFPLGAHGAGRFAKTGSLFGCNAFSGQGGAYREFGEVKIAAFVIVNALGAVTDREGRVAACYPAEDWPADLRIADILKDYSETRASSAPPASRKNTTVSLLVTNQTMEPAVLKRLGAQVHTSMARALQPFATLFDGDVLYAVSTGELEEQVMTPAELGTLASEVMWDAILSSVPPQPEAATPASKSPLTSSELQSLAGRYSFSQFAELSVEERGGELFARATGKRDVYAIGREEPVKLLPVNATDFMVPGRYPLLLRFESDKELMINPGHWQQKGLRQMPGDSGQWHVCAQARGGQRCDFSGASALQDAIDQASPGDTIVLRSGVHQPVGSRDVSFQDVVIRAAILIDNQRLLLRGEPGAVLAGTPGNPATAIAVHGGEVELENLSIHGFHHADAEDAIYDGHGIFVINGSARIRDVVITGLPKMALSIRGSSQVDAAGLTVRHGHIGAWIEEDSELSLRDSRFAYNDSAGVAAYQRAKVRIASSSFEFNEDDGVYSADEATVEISNSEFIGNAPYGLRAENNSRISIDHSLLRDNARDVGPDGQDNVERGKNMRTQQ